MSNNTNINSFLNLSNLSSAVKNIEYAVRGKIVIRAGEIEKELKQGLIKPFDKVIRANIGDCHATGQKPVTFIRQVIALCTYPELLNDEKFPQDAKDRAKRLLNSCAGGSVGSYTDSTGLDIIKQDIAKFISLRDNGILTMADDIFLSSGASSAIRIFMEFLLNDPNDKPIGFMIPIPQYPFYSASTTKFSAQEIGYYLNEENNWALCITELERAYQSSLDKCEPKAICIINPGNPTGQVLSLENMQEIIKWAYEKKLIILADEVYQENIYSENLKFHSFKKVAYELGAPYSLMEIASFYSCSKGWMGECGLRGGYAEIVNLDQDVKTIFKKFHSTQLCSSVLGQICMDIVVNPPQQHEQSYELFIKEKSNILNGLKEKAKLVTELLNKIEGISCNPVLGAMYCFPKLNLPNRAIEHAKSLKMEPDMFYCMELLEQTGICVIPGSGFKQKTGTYHFRSTILPPIEEIKSLLSNIASFHFEFMNKWTDNS